MAYNERLHGVVSNSHCGVPAEVPATEMPKPVHRIAPELKAQAEQTLKLVESRILKGALDGTRPGISQRVELANPHDLDTRIQGWWHKPDGIDTAYTVRFEFSEQSHRTEEAGVLAISDVYGFYFKDQELAQVMRAISYRADPENLEDYEAYCRAVERNPRHRKWSMELKSPSEEDLSQLWTWMVGAQPRPKHLKATPAHQGH